MSLIDKIRGMQNNQVNNWNSQMDNLTDKFVNENKSELLSVIEREIANKASNGHKSIDILDLSSAIYNHFWDRVCTKDYRSLFETGCDGITPKETSYFFKWIKNYFSNEKGFKVGSRVCYFDNGGIFKASYYKDTISW